MTNKITKVYKNGVEYDIYASGGAAGTGDVTGPSSSTNGHLAVFDGTTGKIIKDGGAVPSTAYCVKTSGNQTIAGTKTFSTSPVVPSKTADATNTGTAVATEAQVYKKQNTLVSGTNIKTINSNSLLGSGDISLNDVKVASSAPANPTEGMVWYDTTNDQLKVYDGTNWNVTGKEYNAGKGIEIGNDYSAMQGPAPDGFHIPSKNEWQEVLTMGQTINARADGTSSGGEELRTYLKLPCQSYRVISTGNIAGYTNYLVYMWCSSPLNNYGDSLKVGGESISSFLPKYSFTSTLQRGFGCPIRAFKNVPVIPDNTWTTIYDGSSTATNAGIFHNSTLGLISISSDGINWKTISDKNIGATAVRSSGNITDNQKGYFYQRGNNYGFSNTGSVTTSSTQVDASNYGPGNYYSSSTFITTNPRDSSNNGNLWGGVTGVVSNAITNTGVLSVNGQTGDVNLYSTITVTLTSSGWSNNTQTVTATGVTANNSVVISPAPAGMMDYTGAMIYCSAQASNSLTFNCTTTPNNDIVVNVLILN